METENEPHVALLSSPGVGHLIPIVELGKRLTTLYNTKITIFIVTTRTSTSEQKLLDPLIKTCTDNDIRIMNIPAPDISEIVDPAANIVGKLGVLMREAKPAIRESLLGLMPKPKVVIFDFFAHESFSVAQELGISRYIYVPSSAWFLALTISIPILHETIMGEYIDQTEPLKILGCRPVRPQDVVDPMLDRSSPDYAEKLKMCAGIALFDGFLVNTWEDLESTTLAAFRENEIMKRVIRGPVFDIGPLTWTGNGFGESESSNWIMEWLNRQPARSVLYMSFGSGGLLSREQINEMALGLEMSQQRFLWVVRPPNEEAGGSYFSLDECTIQVLSKYLPDGFESRTRDVGLLVPIWAPQIEILSHPSVGGFMSHNGWNSTLESLTHGVPMIVWPLYAEQRMNAAMLAEELRVAVRSKELPAEKVVKRDEIETLVRTVMSSDSEKGIVVKSNAKELQVSAKKALDDGGSSKHSMTLFLQHCKVFRDREFA